MWPPLAMKKTPGKTPVVTVYLIFCGVKKLFFFSQPFFTYLFFAFGGIMLAWHHACITITKYCCCLEIGCGNKITLT
jgi:hypothetical protein